MKTIYFRMPRRALNQGRANWGFVWMLLGDLVFWVMAVMVVWAFVT